MSEMTPEILSPIELLGDSAVAIRAEGNVVVTGLTDEFKINIAASLVWMDNDLLTDDDFDRAKKDIKDSKTLENRLKTAVDDMINGQKEVAETKELVDGYVAELSTKRLNLNTSVKTRDIAKKKEITGNGKSHVERVLSLTSVERVWSFDTSVIDNAIKNKKKYHIMEESVNLAVIDLIERLAWFEYMYDNNANLIAESLVRVPTLKYHDKNVLLIEDTKTLKLTIIARELEQELILKEEAERRAAKKIEDDRIAKEKADKEESDRLTKVENDPKPKTKAAVVVMSSWERQPTTGQLPPETPSFQEPPPISEDKTYTIFFRLTGSEQRKIELCERLRLAQGVSDISEV